MNVKDSLTKDVPMTNVLPPPCQVLNQSAEYQVIEKAAHLLKKVEQHWKKSLFQNRLQFSPVSDSLNSSESEQYIEKLAAIKFKDASFRNKQIFPHADGQQHSINHAFRREASLEQNLLMSYDVVSNYFDLVDSKEEQINSSPGSARARGDGNYPTKCQRCLEKDRSHGEVQKKSSLSLPRQQYVLKQNNYGRRGGFSKNHREGVNVQISPRSNESLPTSRTYATASPLPRNKTIFPYKKTPISSSNPDLRNINVRECTRHRQQTSARCYHNYCGTDRLNSSSRANYRMGDGYNEIVKNNNVSIVNVTSRNQDVSAIPEVNPRKIASAPDKLIIIQHLPQVDIRPELSKQSGPVINIEAEAHLEEVKDMKNNNIGVFNYIHKNAKQSVIKENRPFSNYHKLSGNTCSDEESFAAQLELRSVAENFVYRLKKNDNPSGLLLMSTLLRLIDEVNELIDLHLSDRSGIQPDPNLPPRMEMVSDLLSDELKTWGAQHPAHYQSLNNIIQHLILDIHFVKNGNFDLKEFGNAATLNQEVIPSSSKKASILKKSKNLSQFDHYSHHRHILLNEESNYEKERNDVYTHRSNHSEELSLSDKLLQENALKVQRLEKAYKINHRVRIIQRKEEAKKIAETEIKKDFNDISRASSISEAHQLEDKTENSPDSNRHQSLNGTSSNASHPVVAIISPSQIESRDDEDKTISERASAAEDEDKSVAEEIQEEGELESISEDGEDSPSKPSRDHTKSPGNLSDKPVSDIEDEVEEVLSESSQPPDDKQAAASDYDEDFEPDVTENPSQSATASSLNEKEKMRKLSHSCYKGVDEICQTDQIDLFCIDSTQVQEGGTQVKEGVKDQVFVNKSTVVDPSIFNLLEEGTKNERTNNSKQGILNKLCNRENEFVNYKPTDLLTNARENISQPLIKNTLKTNGLNEQSANLINADDNFVKVHVRDEKGEIILSYAGSRPIADGKETPISTEANIAPKSDAHETIQNQLKSHTASSLNNYIESERKVLENLTSHVLKELLDDKIQEILSKYTFKGISHSDKLSNVPSSSGVSCIKEKSTQTLSDLQENPVMKTELDLDNTKGADDYHLKSPSMKLIEPHNILNDPHSIVQLPNNEPLVDSKVKTIEIEETKRIYEGENSCSPDMKLLISMVEEMDSSDIEYCETSLKNLSEEEPKDGIMSNKNLRLHHFNSDEFIVYPRLNPQPSEIKTLQYSKEKHLNEISGNSRKSDTSIRNFDVSYSQRTTLKSTGTACNLIDIDRLNPLPENHPNLVKNSITLSTQTENVQTVKPYKFNSSSNLVDLIEISCSQSSSSASDSLRNRNCMVENPILSLDVPLIESKNDEIPITNTKVDSGTQVDKDTFKSIVSEASSTPHSETNSPSLCNRPSSKLEFDRGSTALLEQNDEISSSSNAESSSETIDSWNRLGSPDKRLFEVSSARPAAWSSSSESTSDDERIFVLNQPLSDDDILDDLEQLMDYLKNSKSSTYKGRFRHCSYHKKS